MQKINVERIVDWIFIALFMTSPFESRLRFELTGSSRLTVERWIRLRIEATDHTGIADEENRARISVVDNFNRRHDAISYRWWRVRFGWGRRKHGYHRSKLYSTRSRC